MRAGTQMKPLEEELKTPLGEKKTFLFISKNKRVTRVVRVNSSRNYRKIKVMFREDDGPLEKELETPLGEEEIVPIHIKR